MSFASTGVMTREALSRMLTTPSPSPITWAQQFTAADGTEYIVTLDAAGTFSKVVDWVLVPIGSTVAGARVSSAVADGRLYMAISDGSRGIDIPCQFDGTTFGRVSQNGPAAGPTIANLQIGPTVLAGIATVAVATIASYATTGEFLSDNGDGTFTTVWSSITVTTTAAHGFAVGDTTVLAGTALDGSYGIRTVPSLTSFILDAYTTIYSTGASGTATRTANMTLSRSQGVVAAYTGTVAHGLRSGMSFAVTGIDPQVVGGGVASIVIAADGDQFATVTTNSVHGLIPGNSVMLSGVNYHEVGGSLVSNNTYGGVLTCTTSAAHNLQPGALVYLNLAGVDTVNRYPFVVATVPSATTFTILSGGADGTDTRGGHVYLRFPATDTGVGDPYVVTETPTPTTFQIPISYVTGTWTSGALAFAWDGTFYVETVLSPFAFSYVHLGPNGQSSTSGTVTPKGQISPGVHSCVLIFETDKGYTTAPSPKVKFTATGGGYAIASDIAIGPANVRRRILAFTGANGSKYRYLPVAPKDSTGTYLIGTSTVLDDNTSTSIFLDFADQALEAGLGIDIPGNNLFRQVTLEPALAVLSVGRRLAWWGGRNTVVNLLNMGFEGGVSAGAPTVPLGWTVDEAGGTLVSGDFGLAWQVTGGTGRISQGAFEDADGTSILQPDTIHTFRFWQKGTATGGTLRAQVLSGGGVLAEASIPLSTVTGFREAAFAAPLPHTVPPDARLSVFVDALPAGEYVTLDEMSVGFSENPYRNPIARLSYVDNSEAYDDLTGDVGPGDDSSALIGMFVLRDELHMLTQERLYAATSTADSEPSGWPLTRVADRCGLVAPDALTTGEGWAAWAGKEAAFLYRGGLPQRVSNSINATWQAFTPIWCANDTLRQRVYFGSGAGLLVYDYHGVDDGQPGKWTPWTVAATACARVGGDVALAVGVNLYGLDATKVDDDDLGPIPAVYTPAPFGNEGERVLYSRLFARVVGTGTLTVKQFITQLTGAGKVGLRPVLSPAPETDIELGLNLSGRYLFLRVSSTERFRLERMEVGVEEDPNAPVAGRY